MMEAHSGQRPYPHKQAQWEDDPSKYTVACTDAPFDIKEFMQTCRVDQAFYDKHKNWNINVNEKYRKKRWYFEKHREPIRRGQNDVPHGIGSWYQRSPYDYSNTEFYACQGSLDRVRTADCNAADRQFRRDNDDDSQFGSDWLDRTFINKTMFCDTKVAETCNDKSEAKKWRRTETGKKRSTRQVEHYQGK
jgi:hypothetical protein